MCISRVQILRTLMSERYSNAICYPAVDGLPVAGVAEGPSAEEHSVLLLHAVGLAYDRVAQPGHLPAQLLLDR